MPVNFEEIRHREWPVLETMTFLDVACVSFAPQRSVRALKDLADFSARQDEANSNAHHIAMDSKRHKAYAAMSRSWANRASALLLAAGHMRTF